jgi:hypothetical protein
VNAEGHASGAVNDSLGHPHGRHLRRMTGALGDEMTLCTCLWNPNLRERVLPDPTCPAARHVDDVIPQQGTGEDLTTELWA